MALQTIEQLVNLKWFTLLEALETSQVLAALKQELLWKLQTLFRVPPFHLQQCLTQTDLLPTCFFKKSSLEKDGKGLLKGPWKMIIAKVVIFPKSIGGLSK